MNKSICVLIFIILIACFLTCGSKQPVSLSYTEDFPIIEVHEPTRAEQVIKALQKAYPDQIDAVEYRNDDWAVLLRGTWYYFANGRLLPEEKISNSENYRALQFYHYPAQLPPWTARTPEETERFRNMTANRRQNTLKRSSYFLDSLWQAATRLETERRLVRITFLGRRLRVHQGIQEKLELVETRILAIAKMENEVQAWVDGIGTVEGWHWRNIADVDTRSYHSYGLAIDLLPRAIRGRQTYWLWTSQYREDWWNVSYNERYHPPQSVINAFETYGFIWGGKWLLFDTMHFEYRPEILAFNDLLKTPVFSE
ncbi:MAG: M15 family metallopeptidase [Treponema sp.]|nr:M15 family metallopeptidase [Treponema sp.]